MEINTIKAVKNLMKEFSFNTGLDPEFSAPTRYLWTDAFAVCNYIGLYKKTNEEQYLNLALRLVNQVHQVLGKHRNKRSWISGLDEKTGEKHPTIGGLRIGKELNERQVNEEFNETLEWERDGQYYHYITKWIHALNNTAKTTQNIKYVEWASELLKTAHNSFTYTPKQSGHMMMYWKMSIDLKRPLMPSMGQHDPLDGYLTYKETQTTYDLFDNHNFNTEIKEIGNLCSRMDLETTDPLGIGGLLSDAARATQLIVNGGIKKPEILDKILESALRGIRSYLRFNQLELNANYRLAFRELGFSLGLKGLKLINVCFEKYPEIFTSKQERLLKQLENYSNISRDIEIFWLDPVSQESENWKEHRDINTVMLATSLFPDGFLRI